jgi:hypothetical protein
MGLLRVTSLLRLGGSTVAAAGGDRITQRVVQVKAGGLGSRRQQADPQAAWPQRLAAYRRAHDPLVHLLRGGKIIAQCPLATSIVSACVPLCELPLGIGWNHADDLRDQPSRDRKDDGLRLVGGVCGGGRCGARLLDQLVSVRGPLEVGDAPAIPIFMCAAHFKRMDTTRAISGVGAGLVGRDERE